MKFIAEIGSNHNQNKNRLLELIETSKHVGADAVKLQMFDERLGRTKQEKDLFKSRMLPSHFMSIAYHACKDLKMELHCTPFHPDFVPVLDPFLDGFKIGSYELLWLDLIKACAETRKPITISCGGGTIDEITNAYNAARLSLPQELISLYHCIPFYPANSENMHRIYELQKEFPQSFIGYSDHTMSTKTLLHATMLGAREIEFHLDLPDGEGAESIYVHCWQPKTIQSAIQACKNYKPFDNEPHLNEYDNMRAQRTNPIDGMRGMYNGE